jgi:hypothetical protein
LVGIVLVSSVVVGGFSVVVTSYKGDNPSKTLNGNQIKKQLLTATKPPPQSIFPMLWFFFNFRVPVYEPYVCKQLL